MSTQFTSHAVNYCNALNTQVDPRSGQFMVNFPIANLVGNHHMGPDLSLSLRYSPMSTTDEGFGTGFSIGLTSFNNTTNLLQLSSGEQYKVDPGTVIVRNKKLNNFRFVYSNGRDDSKGYKVLWKEGKIEELSKTEDYQTFVTTAIISPLGRRLTLSWDWSGQVSRLSKVKDEHFTLCEVVYGTTTKMMIWPGARDKYQLDFQLINSQLDVITRKVSKSKTLRWHFNYDQVGHPGNNLALTGVKYPTGMTDTVEYTLQEGLRFPDNSGQGARLPCVLTHIRNPGSKQPETITQYEFTTQNFLGYNGDFGDWDSNSDYLYKTLTDYTYGSTEKVISNNVTVTTARTYNNYHFIINEEVNRNGHIRRTETTYYAEPNMFIDGQPAQFQLPKKKTDTFQAPDGSERTLVTLTEFDESANPLKQVDSDGTVTEYIWYPANGENVECPAEPNGFVRFIKEKRVTPPQTIGNEAVYSTKYSYALLKPNNVIQKSKSSYRGQQLLRERNWHYDDAEYKNNKKNTEFGRITLVTDKIYNSADNSTYTSSQSFMTSVNNNEMVQKATVTGHDGLKTEITRCQSVFSRQKYSEISAQGIKTNYTYDELGRLISRTLCPNTEYESTKTWEYCMDSNGPYSIEIDETGNKTKTYVDGSGRTISKHRYDPETYKWYETLTCSHNALGEVGTGEVKDYLPAVSSDIYPLSSIIAYDGWGEKKEVTYSDGRKTIQNSDPITLSQTVYTTGSKNNTISSGNATTTLDEKSLLPIKKLLQEQTGGKTYSTNFYKWDGLGQMVEEKDELGQITKRTYDEYGRVLTLTSADGTIVTKTYAPHMTSEQVTSISVTGVDANGDIKTWILGTQTFDSLGRLTKRVSGGRATSYRYQGASPVPSSVTLPSGKIIEYTYIPELGNVVSSVKAEGITQTFDYDKKTGKPLMAQTANSKLKNTYSKVGQLEEEIFFYRDQVRKASHTYTLKGAPATYTDVSGKQMKYSMDKHGRVTSIDDDILDVGYKYDALGRPIEYTVRGKGHSCGSFVTTELSYDAFGREITRNLKDDQGMTLTVRQKWQKNNILESRTITKNNTTFRQEQYQYDSRNRLVRFTAVGSTPTDAYGNSMIGQNYSYDALNNLTSVTTFLNDGTSNQARYIYENKNDPTQLTKVINTHPKYPADISLTYDSEGRMTRDHAGRTLTYDVLGRLINVSDEKTHSSGSYDYDAMNRLIKRNIGSSQSTELYYRGSELTNEINISAHKATRLIKNNHTCHGVTNDTGLTLTAADKNDSLLWSKDTNSHDEGQVHLWSPYGSGQPVDKVPGFNGERFDTMTGTYHLGNGYRDYNPTLMRFNCPDSLSPFGAGGINPYAYCSGDPINHTDPSGHLSWPAIIGIVAGVVGLGLAIFTAGASIAAAGGVMAAISSASATSLIIGGLGVVSDLTGIVSGALEDSHPEASSALGWISLGTGLAGLAAAGISKLGKFSKGLDEFRQLTDGYANEALMNVPVREVPTRSIPEGMGAWHVHDTGNGAKFYGSNTAIRARNVGDAVEHLEYAGTGGKNTRILSGVHGERHGINWEKRGDMFVNKTRHIDNTFFVSDTEKWHNVRLGGEGGKVKVHDIANITEEAFQQHLFSGDNIILAHCYSRNDALIRDLLQLPPVTSYARIRTRVG